MCQSHRYRPWTEVQDVLGRAERDLLVAACNAVTHEQAKRLEALADLVAAERAVALSAS